MFFGYWLIEIFIQHFVTNWKLNYEFKALVFLLIYMTMNNKGSKGMLKCTFILIGRLGLFEMKHLFRCLILKITHMSYITSFYSDFSMHCMQDTKVNQLQHVCIRAIKVRYVIILWDKLYICCMFLRITPYKARHNG